MDQQPKLHRILPFVMALIALPALAQFEVSPDHFDDQATTKARSATRQAEHAVLKQQLAFEKPQLEGYGRQIEDKAAQVEQARPATISPVGNSNEVRASTTLAAQEKKLEHLKTALAGPMREAEARIAQLCMQLLSVPSPSVAGLP